MFIWLKEVVIGGSKNFTISLKIEFRDVTKKYEAEVYITLYSVFKVSINEKDNK